MNIGEKIKQLRIKYGLTQEELAARTELSKGFISQLERDLTSPSIATLVDILEALGTDIHDFFSDRVEEKVVFTSEDIFVKEDEGVMIRWLVTNSQKNDMEPILITLQPGARAMEQDAHEGEEFGYVLSGIVTLNIGARKQKVRKGDSFYFHPAAAHYLENTGKLPANVLWVSTPPSF
jgi:transcriptional regulator with XRE-family HTH domain